MPAVKENEDRFANDTPPQRLAEKLSTPSLDGDAFPLLDHVESLGKFLRQAHRAFVSQAQAKEITSSQAAEWMLDNHYIVQQALRQVKEDLSPGYYGELPKLAAQPWQGYPHVYIMACAYLQQETAQFSPLTLQAYVAAFQEIRPLTIGELWALPIMLRINILELLAHALIDVLEKESPTRDPLFEISDNLSTDRLVGNCVLSLRAIAAEKWKEFFEQVSLVDQMLGGDPAGVYWQMDFETRDRYRKVVEQIAQDAPHTELAVAQAAIRLAAQAARKEEKREQPDRTQHVGYYLIDQGRMVLERELNYRPAISRRLHRWLTERHTAVFYLGSIGFLSVLIWLALVAYAYFNGGGVVYLILVGLLALIPGMTLATNLINDLVHLLVAPRLLPKLDFSEGVPAQARTMVVVPCLITSAEEVNSLLEQLELHYLRNTSEHVTFALLTDFADAPEKQQPNDAEILEQVKAGIQSLNKRYPGQPFYLFHRQRLWNPQEEVWMGWERKRGKLEEFNHLLLDGEQPSFTVQLGDLSILPAVRYVITLDADTIMPRGAARRLIGTLAHPLNRAQIDPESGELVAGYTILQPRTEIKPISAGLSRFTRIYSGATGLDLYTHAVSDVYQDLFGEGIYVGKGIYDVAAFTHSLKGRVPENALLSHDLFEGLHGRAGLVTDIILYEDYPADYLAYTYRKHRWIRGDWQLLPWLRSRVPHREKGDTANPLTAIDLWKIGDNLRRSLLAPALLLLLVAGWLGLPGSPLFWTLIALIPPAVTLFSSLLSQLIRQWRRQQDAHYSNMFQLLRQHTLNWLLFLTFLPYEALLALGAITTVLARLFITRKSLLKWTTAAHTVTLFGRRQKLAVVLREMGSASLLAIIIGAFIVWLNSSALPFALPFIIAWVVAPQAALWLSQPIERQPTTLQPEQKEQLHLLARQTWLFFEQFVGPVDQWLPPDHYQEHPRGLVAHRTSPTNIGLALLSALAAYDLGYLGLWDCALRVKNSFQTMETLERYRGHFLNWYDTRTKKPLPPRYVSTVDSGNLAACLLILRQGCLAMPAATLPRWQRWQGFLDTLLALDTTLAQTASQAPEQTAELRGLLSATRQRVRDHRGEPEGWAALLADLVHGFWPQLEKKLVHLLEQTHLSSEDLHRLRTWSERLHHILLDMKRRLDSLLPWLQALAETPSIFQEEMPSDLQEAWEDLQKELRPQVQLGDLPALCRRARQKLASLQQELEQAAAPEEKLAAAHQWCADLADKLAATESVAADLLNEYHVLGEQCLQIEKEMRFDFLYSAQREVFRIGYNVDTEKPDPNYYDLLATEARTASLIAIARGEVPQRHWLNLSRPLTEINGQRSLLSWSGTLFEYLMPILFTRHYDRTLLHESTRAAVQAHQRYAQKKGVPWGISESGYYRFDTAMNYQYRAFGVPGLGFKRGLEDDLVISPYASLLALPLFPQAVMENIEQLTAIGMRGDYGFYEAIDYTADRLALGQDKARVRSFMAHHQGMILLSLVNTLQEQPMVERFHRDPRVQTIDLLLQERVPDQAPLQYPAEEETEPHRQMTGDVTIESWTIPRETPGPQVHYLSNGRYSLLLTNAGSGFSRWQETDLTRWRADTTRDDWGSWLYIRNQDNGRFWSATPQPLHQADNEHEVIFTPHKVDYRCEQDGVVTNTEITVSPEDDVEIRRVKLTNRSDKSQRLLIASYGEVVLAAQDADRHHPAFNKMFIESAYLDQFRALLFTRRLRSAQEQSPAIGHLLVMEPGQKRKIHFETDRARFLGRGGAPQNPAALKLNGDGFKGTVGATLDPIMSLAVEIELAPHATATVAFLTVAEANREKVRQLAEKYQDWDLVSRAFHLARDRSEMEIKQLELDTDKLRHLLQLLSLLIYPQNALRSDPDILVKNRLGQSGLWPFAISGDYPILLARIHAEEELGLARELIVAHKYWRNRGLKIDLIFLNEQTSGYNQELQGQLRRLLYRLESEHWLNRRGGIFLLQRDTMSTEEQVLLSTVARVALDGEAGSLAAQLPDMASQPSRLPAFVPARDQWPRPEIAPVARPEGLRFDNGWGGFSPNGREYLIYLPAGKQTPAPWVNVIANPHFGFLVSESGSGFTWAENSGENRLTPWHNDPVRDRPGEALYLRDEQTAQVWTPTPAPAGAETAHLIRHGVGYSVFETHSHGLKQRLHLFAAPQAPVKIARLQLENIWEHPRRLTATYFAEWVLGVHRDAMQQYLFSTYHAEHHALLVSNPYQSEFGERVAFLSASEETHGFTADRTEFLGRLGSVRRPAGLQRIGLSGDVQPGQDPCAALQLHINLQPGESKEIYFLLGQGADQAEALHWIKQFQNPQHMEEAWQAVNQGWDDLLTAVTVDTPDEAMNLLLNRWLPYQNLSCRIWGRSAFYQSGGAYGFRDQLQDVMAALHLDPAVARQHILRAARHQFAEGDVLHWWHPPSGRGVRTRITDDLLWLPYVTAHYVEVTGDTAVLQEQIPFRQGDSLQEDEEERYNHFAVTEEKHSLYEHCCRALEKGSTAGTHGLPLMGGGDWNDGMNRVGIEGEGESVWLGWFLYATLRDFAPLCQQMGDEDRAQQYRQQMDNLQEALQEHAWDGEWYLRAFYDDGSPLGSAQNRECRIDAIAQSWAVLSGAGDAKRARQGMEAVAKQLIQEADRLLLLFTPPFDRTAKDPGYIKGYPPGIRENGGQYTHAAIWTTWAFAELGDGDRAGALFNLLNPIRHSDTPAGAERYRVEPYVTAADIYNRDPLVGQGGWTWYTGSGSWLYRLGLEAILGLQKRGDQLFIRPCIPATWREYSITLRHGKATYHIQVENPDGVQNTVSQWVIDGEARPDGAFPLVDDGQRHHLKIVMGANAHA